MNYKMMCRFMAQILTIESVFMIPALIISICGGETSAVRGFLMTLVLMLLIELILFAIGRKAPDDFYA